MDLGHSSIHRFAAESLKDTLACAIFPALAVARPFCKVLTSFQSNSLLLGLLERPAPTVRPYLVRTE